MKQVLNTIFKNRINLILFVILLFAVVTKSWHLYHPDTYMFDEVYVGFTAEEYAKGNLKAWVWDFAPPKDRAYDWSHPPMGRIFMTPVIKILGISSFSRRVVPMLAGVLITLMVFLLSKTLFPKKPVLWLLTAFLTTLDGLILTMSRIGLADTILALFIMVSIYFLWQKKFFFSAIFFGLAVSTKWTAMYFLAQVGIVLLSYLTWKKNWLLIFKNLLLTSFRMLLYFLVGGILYLASYSPLIIHYGLDKFWQLQKQMYWYHTGLVATHPWQSPALSWPILWRPVWFWVEYGETTIANIYALGNPLIFWAGLISVIYMLCYALWNHKLKLFYLLLAYVSFWMPWIVSPRIMFLYHYLPAVPFLCLILAFALDQILKFKKIGRPLVFLFVFACLATFVFFYPYWTGIPVAKERVANFQWLPSWK